MNMAACDLSLVGNILVRNQLISYEKVICNFEWTHSALFCGMDLLQIGDV
jgi:hypothetical protein